jgi:hypothetical protein
MENSGFITIAVSITNVETSFPQEQLVCNKEIEQVLLQAW